jgi:Ran GTPase-activating protein (RanGAP) involved in mRNA processing and transport
LIQNSQFLLLLNLHGCGIGDKGVKDIASGFKSEGSLKVMQKLDISSNDITWQGCTSIREIIEKSHLLEINLTNNLLGDEGVAKFVDLLKEHKCSLNHINLTHCGLGVTAFQQIFESLKQNVPLR